LLFTLPLDGRGERDLLVYWSAARQLAQKQNPYDLAALETRQQEARPDWGPEDGIGLGAWNPPWLLVVLLPLGLLSFDTAVRLWLLAQFGIFALAAYLSWDLAGGRSDPRGFLWVLLAVFTFGATLAAIKIGQIAGLVLLGVLLYVWLLQKGRYYWAGGALLLAAVKPHIIFLFLALAGFHWLRRRRWPVVAGLLMALAVAALTLQLLYPNWLAAYSDLMGGHAFTNYLNATVSGLTYSQWGITWPRYAGLLLLPTARPLALMAERGEWLSALSLSLLLSVPFAPYGFFFDQVVLLPAVIQLIYWLRQGDLSPVVARLIAGAMALIYLVLLWLSTLVLYEYWFVWPPLALMPLYLIAWRNQN
jgi:hypothetical protein